MLGVIQTQTGMNHREYLVEAARIQRVMDQHPEFRTLNVGEDSEGYAYLLGQVHSESDKKELRQLLIQQGGEEWAERCLSIAISVSPAQSR